MCDLKVLKSFKKVDLEKKSYFKFSIMYGSISFSHHIIQTYPDKMFVGNEPLFVSNRNFIFGICKYIS